MLDFLHSETAVSEVIDFVTILGILTLSIGLIGVAGYPMLKNAQEANQIENTKQSFVVLAENVNKVVLGQSPSQGVELKLYGGTLSISGNSTINITAKNSTGDDTTLFAQQVGSIESTVGDTVVAYEGTGVWAKYPNGNAITVYKPLITNQSNVLVIPAPYIRHTSGVASMGGSGMTHVIVEGSAPKIKFYSNMSNITITVTGDYAKGWEEYFENIISWSWRIESGTTSELKAKLNTTDNVDVYILEMQLNTGIV